MIFGAIGGGFVAGYVVLNKIDKRLAVIEVKIGLQIGTDLLGNVNTYGKKGDQEKALQAAATARSVISRAKQNSVPPPAGYFEKAIKTINQVTVPLSPDVAREIFSTRVALAEYRSILEPMPKFPEKYHSAAPGTPLSAIPSFGRAVIRFNAPVPVGRDVVTHFNGAFLDGSAVPSGNDLLEIPSGPVDENKIVMQEGAIFNVTQTLDGVEWKDMVFVNSHIKYRGTGVKLENVRFVNCTFDLPTNAQGAELADYVALDEKNLAIS